MPSKKFGERVYEQQDVPEVTADELKHWMSDGRELLLLDSRTPEEHRAVTIPGSRSVPGGELALRIHDLEHGPNTTVVVHCAGRTRSIVGARALLDVGIENVFALRNGTMGWKMAGLDLEEGSDRVGLPNPSSDGRLRASARAMQLAAEHDVRLISPAELRELLDKAQSENVYAIDSRTREEFEEGHLPGFRWFPGGQVVQRTDEVIGVRSGQVILACDDGIRSVVTASWLRRMGFPNVSVLGGGMKAWQDAGGRLDDPSNAPLPPVIKQAMDSIRTVGALELNDAPGEVDPPSIVEVGTSREFAMGHIPGSRWVPRGWLEIWIADISPPDRPLVIAATDEAQAALAAVALRERGYDRVGVLAGGAAAWRAAGFPMETGLTSVITPPQDVLLAGTERSWADMMQYLKLGRSPGASVPHPLSSAAAPRQLPAARPRANRSRPNGSRP